MKNQHDSGQIRIIEAFLAVLIIFSSLTITANLNVTHPLRTNEYLASIGLQSLMKLDSDGTLSDLIDNKNWTTLRDTLNIVLPAGTCFNLTIYDNEMRQVNTIAISNGAFSSQQISFTEYICASRNPTYRCYILHLYLAVAS